MVGHLADDGHHGHVATAHVAHEQCRGPRAVHAGDNAEFCGFGLGVVVLAIPHEHRASVHATPRIGIAVKETAFHFFARVVAMPVELDVVVDGQAVVGKNFQVVADEGLPPNLRGIGHGVIARPDQTRGIGALRGPVRIIGIAVFHAEVGPSPFTAQADIPRDGIRAAIALLENTGFDFDRAAAVTVFELEIQHAGNGVRAVLCGRAIAQDFHALEGDRRDRGDVGALRAIGNAVAQPVDHGGAVAAFAIDEHHRVVGRQAPQIDRANHG